MVAQKSRRRLGDLYIRGEVLAVDDDTGDPVKVWIQKLNELDRDAVLRRASACKARYELESDHEESETFVATLGSVREFINREGQIATVIAEDLVAARQRVEAQLTHDEKGWGKEDKITKLVDAWTGTDDTPGLAAAYAEDENDPEALRVKGEIEAFEADLDRLMEEEKERLEHEWADRSDQDVMRHAAREILKRRADEEFMREWNRQQIFYAVRELDDHHKRYFGTLQEVDDLDDRVRTLLQQKCSALFIDAQEGKDSPPKPASSTSSESTPETSEASGPEAAIA